MNALRKQFEAETGLSVDYDDLKTYWVEYAHWFKSRLEQEINGRKIIVENYKKQLESKATANEGKVREDNVEPMTENQIRIWLQNRESDFNDIDEILIDFQGYLFAQVAANPSLFAEDKGVDWVSVEEGLPNKYTLILVVIPSQDYEITVATYENHNRWVNHYDNTFIEEQVTHWMPLPNQPEFKKKGAEK